MAASNLVSIPIKFKPRQRRWWESEMPQPTSAMISNPENGSISISSDLGVMTLGIVDLLRAIAITTDANIIHQGLSQDEICARVKLTLVGKE